MNQYNSHHFIIFHVFSHLVRTFLSGRVFHFSLLKHCLQWHTSIDLEWCRYFSFRVRSWIDYRSLASRIWIRLDNISFFFIENTFKTSFQGLRIRISYTSSMNKQSV